jgi:hypothetical protein
VVRDYVKESLHLRQLQQLGYQIIALRDADNLLRLDVVDQFLSAGHTTISNFELGFQGLTLGQFWYPSAYEFTQWQIVQAQLDVLENLPAESDQPRFVFAHILSPHPPFVFAADGEFVARNLFMAGDGSDYGGTTEEYLAGYIGQVQYLNDRVLQIVARWLRDRNRPIVIILQGDHGPGAYLDWNSLERTCLRERLPIFNAYYFSDQRAQQTLYPSISPVNSLRVVFDQFLGQPMELLPDRSFYSASARPFDFIDVTEARESCGPLE